MADKNDITFEIMEHIGTIDVIDGREERPHESWNHSY